MNKILGKIDQNGKTRIKSWENFSEGEKYRIKSPGYPQEFLRRRKIMNKILGIRGGRSVASLLTWSL